MIEAICRFNKEVLHVEDRPLQPLSDVEFDYLMKAFAEEIQEIKEGHGKQDIIEFVDGVLDLCYFAIGGLYRAGVSPEKIRLCFNAIHEANMTKKKGVQAKRGGKAVDAVKPEGWTPPEEAIAHILLG